MHEMGGDSVSAGTGSGSSVFDKLVTELSAQERQDLLARVRFSQEIDDSPLREPEPTPESRFDRVYQELGFFERVVLFLRSVLTGKDRVSLVQEFALKRVVRSVNGAAAQYFNVRSMELLEPFFEEIDALKRGVELFRKPLKEALGVHKKDFIAFLAGMELPVVQEHLLNESTPEHHASMITELSDFDLRRALESALHDAFEEISEADRQTMYRDVQLLHWLQSLASYGFERILGRFASEDQDRTCPGNTLLASLKELSSILQRLTIPPSAQLVSSIFLFASREQLQEKEFDLEGSLQGSMIRARESLSTLRQFNAKVPLNDIIRIIVNDTDWMPPLKGGGEDWFVLFKQFWADRLDERVGGFVLHRNRRHLLQAAIKMLRLAELPYLPHYRSTSEPPVFRPEHEHTIAFLHGFLKQVFTRELNSTVKIFLLDGKFYKDDNRQEFTTAYDHVDQLPERIQRLEQEMGPDGRRGKMLAQISDEHTLPASREKAAASVYIAADKEAEVIVLDGKRHLRSLQNVLEGILHGHGDDTYDTISNLSQIGGRENRRLLMALRTALGHLAAANEIYGGLIELETEKS